MAFGYTLIFYFFLPNRTLDWFKSPQEATRDDESVWYDQDSSILVPTISVSNILILSLSQPINPSEMRKNSRFQSIFFSCRFLQKYLVFSMEI